MKKVKEYFRDLIAPFFLMLLLGIFFTFLLHIASISIFNYNLLLEPDKEKRLDSFIKIIGVAISITGFISIIFTIIQSRKNIQREIQKSTVDLFREFRSERIKNARDRAWDVKEKWEKQEYYKQEYLKYNFDNPLNIKNAELSKDTNAIYDLLEFYLILSSYDGDKQVLMGFRYFYYGWWRPFLYDIATEIEFHRGVNPILNLNSPDYVESISFIKSLEKLDRLCGLDSIPKNEILHYDGG